MGVALENARLFDETKAADREDQRAAELAVINEIGEALREQLEFDAIIDLVGERIRAMFATSRDMYIAISTTATGVDFPYAMDDGATTGGHEPSMPRRGPDRQVVMREPAPAAVREMAGGDRGQHDRAGAAPPSGVMAGRPDHGRRSRRSGS